MRVHLIKVHALEPADAACKARQMSHKVIPETGLSFKLFIYNFLHNSTEAQRMTKKQLNQKVNVEVLSLSSHSSAIGGDDSRISSPESQTDTSNNAKWEMQLRRGTKRRLVIYNDDDSDSEDHARKKRKSPSSSDAPAPGTGFDSDALEFSGEDPTSRPDQKSAEEDVRQKPNKRSSSRATARRKQRSAAEVPTSRPDQVLKPS